VTSGKGGQEESYVGLASDFKRRFYKHKESLTVKKSQGVNHPFNTFFERKRGQRGP
jgi:predicted GIY-YIG superfamily endonuclease